MLKHLRYLRYVLRHKRLVYREGRKLGLSRRTLLAHDLSKFSRAEWTPYVEWFYGREDGKGWVNAPDKVTRTETVSNGVTTITATPRFLVEFRQKREAEFQAAWKHHYRNNPHHWNYWVETYDEWRGALDRPRAREMPDEYRREMLADWRAMGYGTKGYDDSREFYLKTGGSMVLHPQTRAWVEEQLGIEEIVYAVA